MLKIFFGDMEEAVYGPTWFKYNYEPIWFDDSLVQDMILEVDQTKYVSGSVFESPVLGMIPPERLSGGVKTLIMIYKMPEKIFDATSCGANCAHMLLEIGKREDVTVNLRYYMPMKGLGQLEIEIANTGMVVTNEKEYALAALDCLDEAGL
ncbi:MAG: DUF4869 domain-containing protein [Mogibacterium sp.]|nr:DUF4869 domain-containing protein [Mogibacterium sp.]